jgi:hypothetical protein
MSTPSGASRTRSALSGRAPRREVESLFGHFVEEYAALRRWAVSCEGGTLVRATDGGLLAALEPSDADGYTLVKSCEAVGAHLRGFPRSLGSMQARAAFAIAQGSLNALDPKVLELGEAVVVVGEERPVVVVLPSAYFDQEEGE